MQLIDRYVQEVGQNLPANLRQEIVTELRSLLEDTVEDRAARTGQKANEEVIVAVLEEFGPPEKVAASYAPPDQYLIGPKLYPVFVKIVKVVLVLLFILFALNVAGMVADSSASSLPVRVLNATTSFFDSAFMLLGVTVLIFAIVERLESKSAGGVRRWDPRKLPAAADPNRVDAGWLIGETVIIGALLILLNFFPQWVGAIIITDEGSRFLPVLAPEFNTHLLWINLWLGLSLLLNIWVLGQRQWRRVTHWLDVGLNLLGVFVLYRLLSGAPLIGITPDWAGLHGWTAEALAQVQQNVIPILSTLFNVAVVLILLILLVTLGLKIYELLGKRTAPVKGLSSSMPK